MNPRIDCEEVFLRVVELTPQERPRALDELCPTPESRAEVERLLESDDRLPEGFLAGDQAFLPEVQPGSRVGPYLVLERLGEGGMGTVYTAHQSFPEREVALKVLRAGRISEDTVRRFRHEIDVLGRLQHNGIARIYDAGTIEGPAGGGGERPWFTMELVRGVPLVRYARQQGLGIPERLELLARVCDAVHYAHQRGVIHRDLKNENVLVTTEESTATQDPSAPAGRVIGQPKVLDFGIARVMDAELARGERQTVAGTLLGTLGSMSPEQVAGDSGLVDVRSDVYALGVMLYELLCGRPPLLLDGLTVPQAIGRVLEQEPEPPARVDPSLRGDLTTIALKALEKDPERRYQTAAELAQDLRSALRGEPIEARADSRLYLLHRSLRRHRVAAAVALGFALVLLVFTAISLRQARHNADLAAAEAAARERSDADFQRALEAVDLLTELGSQRLVGTPQAGAARRELLEAALGFYRGLLTAYPERDELQERQVLARVQVARIERELGNAAEARSAIEGGIEELEAALERQDGEDLESRLELVSARTLRGNLLHNEGRLEEAELQLGVAVEDAEELLAELEEGSPWRAVALLEFASACKHMSICLQSKGQLEGALDYLLVARDVVEPALEREPSTELASQLLALLHQSCVIRLLDGEGRQSEPDFRRGIELAEELIANEAAQPRHRRDLAMLRTNFGVALGRWGRPEEAREELELAVLLGEELVAEDPAIELPRAELVSGYVDLSSLLMGLEDLEGAEARLERAVELLEEAPAEDRSPAQLGKLATIENMQGALLIHLGRHEDARDALQRSLEHVGRALGDLPGRVDLRELQRAASVNLALSHARLDDHEAAARALRELRFAAEGYVGPNEVVQTLLAWHQVAWMVERDEALAPEERERRATGYAEEAATYLGEAREAGFDDLDELRTREGLAPFLARPAFDRLFDG